MEASIELYEINRSIIDQQGAIEDKDIIHSKFELIKNFANDTNNNFYMMYGKEIGYFTVFARHENWELETLDLAVGECLQNVGYLYSLELTADKTAIEIWVKTYDNDLLTCMYLFPYDNGIVRIK